MGKKGKKKALDPEVPGNYLGVRLDKKSVDSVCVQKEHS